MWPENLRTRVRKATGVVTWVGLNQYRTVKSWSSVKKKIEKTKEKNRTYICSRNFSFVKTGKRFYLFNRKHVDLTIYIFIQRTYKTVQVQFNVFWYSHFIQQSSRNSQVLFKIWWKITVYWSVCLFMYLYLYIELFQECSSCVQIDSGYSTLVTVVESSRNVRRRVSVNGK